MVAALDPLRELDLLRGGEQRDAPDVLQEELEGVGRDLRGGGLDLRLRIRLRRHHLDLGLVESCVELVQLRRLEPELVERERDLVGVQPACLQAALEKALGLLSRKDVLDRRLTSDPFPFACGGQCNPPFPQRSHRSRGGGRRQSNRPDGQRVYRPDG